MAWRNYGWAWNVRGVTLAEQLVLTRLADAADESGYVRMLGIGDHQGGLRKHIPQLKRRAMQKVVSSLISKGFIKERIRRSLIDKKYEVIRETKGRQMVNAWQLDLNRYFPIDQTNPGQKLWTELIEKLRTTADPKYVDAIEHHMRPDYPAWFEIEEGVQRTKLDKRMIKYGLLCVRTESARSSKFCEILKLELVQLGERLDPPVMQFLFTHPSQ